MSNWDEHLLFRTTLSKKKFVKKELQNLDTKLFTTELYIIAFKRANSLYKNKGKLPTFKEIVNDLALSSEVRRKLKLKEIKRNKLKKHDESLALPSSLSEYRNVISKVRFKSTKNNLISFQNELTDRLKNINSEHDLSKLISECESSIIDLQSISRDTSSNLYRLNKKNISRLFKSFGNQIENDFFLPTGFKGFDNLNIGLPKDTFFLLAGMSGTGKSSLMINLALNMKKLGARVCIIPYEMSIESNLIRVGANITNTNITDIVSNYRHYEKDLIQKVSKVLYSKDDASCIDFYDPELGETIDVVLTKLLPYRYDIIFIDYINLVPFMGGDNVSEAVALSKASKYAKSYARKTGTRVCYLAQFDDTEKRVRYSRAMQEDASNYWYWNQSLEEIEELGYIKIIQKKARNQSPKSFKLKPDLACCKYYDYSSKDLESDYAKKIKKSKSMEGFDNLDDIPNEEDI